MSIDSQIPLCVGIVVVAAGGNVFFLSFCLVNWNHKLNDELEKWSLFACISMDITIERDRDI